MRYYTDSSCNNVVLQQQSRSFVGGLPIWVARLVEQPARGYLCVLCNDDGTPGEDPSMFFGTEDSPNSYGVGIDTWFGPGERFTDAWTAIVAIRDGEVAVD